MNKKISNSILGLVTLSMVISSVYIGVLNKDNYKVVDIEGKREELGDVNIVYQNKKGSYKTSEVIISKDNIELDKYVKELSPSYFGNIGNHYNIEHRDLLMNSFGSLYNDEESIGNVEVNKNYTNNYSGSTNYNLVAYVKDKNLKSNKIENYEIIIENDIKEDMDINYRVVPIKYNKELYITLSMDLMPVDYYNEEENIHSSKECLIKVYKLDLKNKSSKLILDKKIGDKKEFASFSDVAFSNDNSAYFMKESYENDKEDKLNKRFDLVKYNVKEDKLIIKQLDINNINNNSIYNYSIDGNKVTFMNTNYSNKNKIEIDIITMDLLNDSITKHELYSIKTEDSNFSYHVNKVRPVDGKIYLLFDAYKENSGPRNVINKQYVYVLDEKNKKTLYTGIIKEESRLISDPVIVKKEEL